MGNHDIAFKKHISCNLKTTEMLDCALKGLCAVEYRICFSGEYKKYLLVKTLVTDKLGLVFGAVYIYTKVSWSEVIHVYPKYSDKQYWANSVYPDQMQQN